MNRSHITILGSTGSIGISTLKVISLHPEKFNVFALAAHKNVARLFQQCQMHRPRYAVMRDENAAEELSRQLKQHHIPTEVLSGEQGLVTVAIHPDVDAVMAAIVGAAGLLSTLAAAKAGKRILLANKEALIMAGDLFIEAVRQNDALLLPVDSEHNAIFQCLPEHTKLGYPSHIIKRIILTASGGAFRDWPIDQLKNATPAEACSHPNWDMGAKITVDSATMMNKGLEVIEASFLFGLPIEKIEVLLHPQSIIHSLVEYEDSSLLAQLGEPDMCIPISYVLDWPKRIASGAKRLDLLAIGQLDFKPLCLKRYPCLDLAHQALRKGGTAPAILNAANEIAVHAFLEGKISFTDIPKLIEHVLGIVSVEPATHLDVILKSDEMARAESVDYLNTCSSSPINGIDINLRGNPKNLPFEKIVVATQVPSAPRRHCEEQSDEATQEKFIMNKSLD